MLKIAQQVNDAWVDRDCPASFSEEIGGSVRLHIGLPKVSTSIFRTLAALMAGPFYVLYVLHTPRGEGEAGRYQSEAISDTKLADFLAHFERFLSCDARHDIWVKSRDSTDLIIWDRHNSIFAYGDLPRFKRTLSALGFSPGEIPPLGIHTHYYREEFDGEAHAMLEALDWRWTPLRPEDEQ